MSFKSQKSFNEEISEIWERSYSVRSLSEESLSCEDESEGLCRQLLHAMNPAVLSQLRRKFTKHHIKSLKDATRKVEQVMREAAAAEGIQFSEPEVRRNDDLWIDQQGFVKAIELIFGNHKFSPHAAALFRTLDPLQTRQISWSSLVTRLVASGERRTASRGDVWERICEDQEIRLLKHCKRETIVKLVNLEGADVEWYCMAAVSRGGRVGLYRENVLLHQYRLWYHRSGTTKRVKNCWVTDAIYMSDVQCMLIAASDRSLTLYDASILTHTAIYCITGLPNIPTCFAYEAAQHKLGTSELTIGDERGDVTRITFLQPHVALIYKNFTDKINCYFWRELFSPPHTAYVSISAQRVHTRSVRRAQYCGTAVATCSRDTIGVVLRHRQGKLKDYVFQVPRGVSCFDVVLSLHLLATGSPDGLVRLWQLTAPAPYAQLTASAAVLDVVVVLDMQIVVAAVKNCCVEIWDLYEECLLQSIKIKYPFLGVLGKKPEFGSYCIYPGPPRKLPTSESAPPVTSQSRRSSVQRGETGGLRLVDESHGDAEVASAPPPTSELLLTCCSYMFTLRLRPPRGAPPPPPGDARAARRPSAWGLSPSPTPPQSAKPESPSPREEFLTVESARRIPAEPADDEVDLDQLIENAGLQGILEKDFLLMMGLKNDLNQKLAELRANMDQMSGPVSLGAPYLALKLHEPTEMPAVDEMTDRYREVMRIFPAGSSVGSSRNSSRASRRSRTSVDIRK